jgi:hypothetical protein
MAVLNRSFLLVTAGFVAGVAALGAGLAFASPGGSASEPSDHAYTVSIDEIRSTLDPGEVFSSAITRKVTMSDGSSREITLRPVRLNGEELVELVDKSAGGANHSFMGPNGTTIDGSLMINVKDMAQLTAAMQKHRALEK